MDVFLDLVVSAAVNVIGYYICQWIERHTRGR